MRMLEQIIIMGDGSINNFLNNELQFVHSRIMNINKQPCNGVLMLLSMSSNQTSLTEYQSSDPNEMPEHFTTIELPKYESQPQFLTV